VSDDVEHRDPRHAEPAGEQVHMPGPSIIPLINAAGLAFAIVSLTLSWILVAFGLIVFIVTSVVWIRHTRRDIADLPLEHGDH
jgi:type IV secretory pathway TrbD component